MEANELRLHNWFMYGQELRQVKSIFPEGVNHTQEIINGGADVAVLVTPIKFVSPVILTPEILEKCGFKYGKTEGITSFEDSDNDPDGTTHYWDIDIKGTELIESHSISLVKWGEQEYFTFQLERGFYRQKIKYLHQLENLYFALAGKELIYIP